mgnify:CR=1 FL=1
MRKTESQKIALCGVLGALSVVLLLTRVPVPGVIADTISAVAALQIGTYAAPMLAAFLLIPVLDEYGPKYALLLYATVSILSVLLVPELELAFFYVFVIGYYPVLRQQLARIKSTLLRWVIKQCSTGPRCWFTCCSLRCSALPSWTSCWPTVLACWPPCWPPATSPSGSATARSAH